MHLLQYLAAQLWPNLAANVLWAAPTGWVLWRRFWRRHTAHLDELIRHLTHHGAPHDHRDPPSAPGPD